MLVITWDHSLMREMARGLAEHVRQRGEPVELVKSKSVETRRGPMRLYSGIHLQWAGRPEFWLIDFRDYLTAKGNPLVRETVHDEDCRLILKGQYRATLYREPPLTKIKPYTYFEMNPRLFQQMRPKLSRVEKRLDRLYFRGSPCNGRDAILPLLQDILEPADQYLTAEEYYREAATARIGLSLPGQGNVCYREIEYFGMGVVALMPHPRNTFHEPLVPNVHYLAANVTPNPRNGAEVAAAVQEAYERHRRDEELLNFIRSNARAWYEKYVWLPNCVLWTARLLGLEPHLTPPVRP